MTYYYNYHAHHNNSNNNNKKEIKEKGGIFKNTYYKYNFGDNLEQSIQYEINDK
jgi:hypothetical protein